MIRKASLRFSEVGPAGLQNPHDNLAGHFQLLIRHQAILGLQGLVELRLECGQ